MMNARMLFDLRIYVPPPFRVLGMDGQFFLVEETGVPGENHRPSASNCQAFSHTAKPVIRTRALAEAVKGQLVVQSAQLR